MHTQPHPQTQQPAIHSCSIRSELLLRWRVGPMGDVIVRSDLLSAIWHKAGCLLGGVFGCVCVCVCVCVRVYKGSRETVCSQTWWQLWLNATAYNVNTNANKKQQSEQQSEATAWANRWQYPHSTGSVKQECIWLLNITFQIIISALKLSKLQQKTNN